MSRPLAITIITLFTLTLATFSTYNWYQAKQESDIFHQQTLELNQRLIRQQANNLAQNDLSARYFFEDDSKARFRFILEIFDAAETARDNYYAAISKIADQNYKQRITDQQRGNDLQRLQSVADSSLYSVLHSAVSVFRTRGASMDLREEDLKVFIPRLQELVAEAKLLSLRTGPLSEQEYSLRRDWLTLSFQSTLLYLLESSNSFYCSRGYLYDAYYPMVMNTGNHLKAGETEVLKIGLGAYSTRLKPENVDLRINGQRQRLGKTGTLEFPLTGRKKGEYSLMLSASVRDEFTGDTTQSEAIYRYVVE